MCPLKSSSVPCTTHVHTHRATKAPAHALSTTCRWGHQQQGQLLKQMRCWSLGALVRRETWRILHIRQRPEAASWTMLLHDISNTGAKIHSQKAFSTPPSAYLCRSWVPRGKSALFYYFRFFSFSQASLRDSVSKVSDYDEGYWYSLYHLQLPNVTTQNFSQVPFSLLQSMINTWCFQRIPSLHLLFCFHIFLLVYFVVFLKLLCYLGTKKKFRFMEVF